MRYPPDDPADKPAGRRRGHLPGSSAGRPQPGGESSVFLPGYDSPREPGSGRQSGGHSSPAAPWHGSAASGAAGRGPVRGYPPLPGQPPPMYPPGQFAAWNRGSGGHARPAGAAPRPDGAEPYGQGWQPGSAGGGPAGAGYYGRDSDPDSEPGYSMLAVSDPAADVTSTQTWQAVGDGRATGTWAAPARPGGPPPGRSTDTGPAAGRAGSAGRPSGAHARPGTGGLVESGPEEGRAGSRRLAPWSPAAAAQRAAGPDQLDRVQAPTGSAGRADTLAGRTGRGDPLAGSAASADTLAGRTGRATGLASDTVADTGQQLTGAGRESRAALAAVGPRSAAAAGRGARRGRTPADTGQDPARPQRPASRRKKPASVKMAVAAALVLVLGAAAALYFGAKAFSSSGHPAAKPQGTPTATAAPTPTLGPYGHIGSRQSDPEPLTIAQLYPASFNAGGSAFVQTNSRLSGDCIDAVSGAGIQAAVSSAGCSQVARATYLDAKAGMMGTIGVLNLRTANAATKAARAAGASNFIAQLPGRSGPTHKLGQGTGIEEALAKGHYLILIWAELTDRVRPKTKAQSSGLEQFMTELLQGTANVSLSDRMVSGTPT
jgi:hypothetical protein